MNKASVSINCRGNLLSSSGNHVKVVKSSICMFDIGIIIVLCNCISICNWDYICSFIDARRMHELGWRTFGSHVILEELKDINILRIVLLLTLFITGIVIILIVLFRIDRVILEETCSSGSIVISRRSRHRNNSSDRKGIQCIFYC